MVSSHKQFTLRNNYPCFPIKRPMEGEIALQERLDKPVQYLLLIKTGDSLFLDTTSGNNSKHTPSTLQGLVYEKLRK
jgi:hypothetical protein